MSDTSSGAKGVKVATIEKKRCQHRGHTTHDEFNEVVWKIELHEHFFDKSPLNFFKILFKVNLDGHITFPSLGSTNSVD